MVARSSNYVSTHIIFTLYLFNLLVSKPFYLMVYLMAVEQKPELLRKEKNELHDKHIEVREVREGISSSQIRSLEEG